MDSTNSQERPNYRLHYKTDLYKDRDWFHDKHDFYAPSDGVARQTAKEFLDKCSKKNKELTNDPNSCYCKATYRPLRLERLVYVIKEVEETTPIPLDGDVASRVRSNSAIELFELSHL